MRFLSLLHSYDYMGGGHKTGCILSLESYNWSPCTIPMRFLSLLHSYDYMGEGHKTGCIFSICVGNSVFQNFSISGQTAESECNAIVIHGSLPVTQGNRASLSVCFLQHGKARQTECHLVAPSVNLEYRHTCINNSLNSYPLLLQLQVALDSLHSCQ